MNLETFLFGCASEEQYAGAIDNLVLYHEDICDQLGPRQSDFLIYDQILNDMQGHIFERQGDIQWYHYGYELLNICNHIVLGTHTDHPFHNSALLYISSHPLYLGNAITRTYAYYVALFGTFVDAGCHAHISNAAKAAREIISDDEYFQIRDRVITLLGGQMFLLEKFEQATRRVFFPIQFLQDFLVDAHRWLVTALGHSDIKSGIPVFQILTSNSMLTEPN